HASSYRTLFFFSSRRRHTRSYGDWSSDVCSSDLAFIDLVLEERRRQLFSEGQRYSDMLRYNLPFVKGLTLKGNIYSDLTCVPLRSEEHTSELQSPYDLVCRLLLEKKKMIS